jgi:hypothetical protein
VFDRGYPFEERAQIVAHGSLAPLAASLAADLDRLLPDEDVFIPPEKARMTRKGGRCEKDGSFLEFDPRSPRRHRCPVCGNLFEAEEHYRWWIMGYQLWLSERAVHAAALGRLMGGRYTGLAESIVRRYAERYASWPNEDNVLGPTRPFFSTYLESIWLLQLSVAVSALESGRTTELGGEFRDRIAEPSSALIAEFNEGLSNRQVWNSAALASTATLLDRPEGVDRAIHGPGGLAQFLEQGLLSDGSWYEGENYHLFAHRGLWYLMTVAQRAGIALPDESRRRFDDGFTAPLRTALPDLTFPARRDSQYRASLRQWRIAESFELGLVRNPDAIELAGGLGLLYGDHPSGDAARWRSTGEAERNVPGIRLTRADLGWKSLLFALAELPPPSGIPPRSALMEGQGFAVIRRDVGQTYVALDYGHSGGSHGHPDRLNLWLVRGNDRVFEDVGTGSYVENTLHWYRSTLAHNAPLVDGKSQDPVSGSLRAWDQRAGYAWVDAEAEISRGVLVRRSVIVADGYLIDRVSWDADRDITFDLPFHTDGDLVVAHPMTPARLTGGWGLEDGFDFVRHSETVTTDAPGDLLMGDVNGFFHVNVPYEWWRATAPGPPGHPERSFLMIRARQRAGRILSVWSWRRELNVGDVGTVLMRIVSDTRSETHRFSGDVWLVESGGETITLDGRRPRAPEAQQARQPTRPRPPRLIPLLPHHDDHSPLGDKGLRFALGESQYRRTEATWREAGEPTAIVSVAATRAELLVEVAVQKQHLHFARPRDENPLDNEHADTNSDGVQIHVAFQADDATRRSVSWLLVPDPDSDAVRRNSRGDTTVLPLTATWAPTGDGWRLLARIDRAGLGAPDQLIGLDVIINEMPPGRERRRGQLVMSATAPSWAYLRGDRQELDQLIPMIIANE